MAETLFLTVASFLCATLSGVLGLGGGSILIVLMLTIMSPAVAIPFHGVIQLVATGNRVILFRRFTAWPLVARYSVLLLPGVAVGMLLFQGLTEDVIKAAIGAFVLTALYIRRMQVFRERDVPPMVFVPFGFVVGAVSIIVGGVGVLFAPFVMRDGLQKEGVVGTQSTMAAMTHLAKVAAFGVVGFRFDDHLLAFALILPAVVVGGYLGRALLHRVNDRFFLWAYQTTLVVLSVKLIVWDSLWRFWS